MYEPYGLKRGSTYFTAMPMTLLDQPLYDKVACYPTDIQTSNKDIITNTPQLSTDTRIIIGYLAIIYHSRPQIAGWAKNEYSYIGLLAAKLNAGSLTLNSLKWQGPGHATTKAQRYTAQAVVAQIMAEREASMQTRTCHDQDADDIQGELDSNHMSVLGILELHDEANPLLSICI
ncbi:hypothetical protein AZE42_02672 [Rhizopogon vesiculosus]|uniref:Uncharacterized protein n=1 Tax=Rhizopogon vesiculosus TaxID=180088 RepID=A0A1J8QML6_9AGAM|nr:hypothetical protein AZE42_02672 [Rhizopogon vesiculosus]